MLSTVLDSLDSLMGRPVLVVLRKGLVSIVDDHRGDTYRAVYVVNVGDCIHVLHAFQKKSKSGISTPKEDVELVEKRLKALLARHGAVHRR